MARLTTARIREMATVLSAEAATPEFISMVREIRGADESETFSVADATIARLKRVKTLPKEFRLSPRAFEPPSKTIAHFDAEKRTGFVYAPDGAIVMVSEREISDSSEPALDEAFRARLQATIREGIEDIGRVVAVQPFQDMLEEMYSHPKHERPAFVERVVLNAQEREKRGVFIPSEVILQRSKFADGRPTLFCATRLLPLAYPWQKVTLTFDSEE